MIVQYDYGTNKLSCLKFLMICWTANKRHVLFLADLAGDWISQQVYFSLTTPRSGVAVMTESYAINIILADYNNISALVVDPVSR